MYFLKEIIFFLSMLVEFSYGFRVPLSYDTQSPFLHHNTANNKNGNSFNHESLVMFSWSNVFLGKLLHQSDIVEIGPRGVRFIQHSSNSYHHYDGNLHVSLSSTSTSDSDAGLIASSRKCHPSQLALCEVDSKEGWFFPSEGAWVTPIFNITSNSTLLRDDALRTFSSETACHGEHQGTGRAYAPVSAYSVTSCDVMGGKYIVVYHKDNESVFVYPQSFGPIAYLLILTSATISTGSITYLSKSETPSSTSVNTTSLFHRYIPYMILVNSLSSILVAAAIFLRDKIHFHTLEDGMVFWIGIVSGLLYGLFVPLLRKTDTITKQWKNSFQIDCCMYALESIATALYRTPENPYASILIFFMACRLWEKSFILCHGKYFTKSVEYPYYYYLRYMDITLGIINFNFICENGMKQQYIFQDVWVFYFITIIFLAYCLVKYQWMIAITVF